MYKIVPTNMPIVLPPISLDSLSMEIVSGCAIHRGTCDSQGEERDAEQATRMPPFMELAFFEDIVRQYKGLPSDDKVVMPQFRGEALEHRQFLDFCRVLQNAGLPFSFTTSATLLTPEISRELLAMPCFQGIDFSIDGVKPETFEAIRIGASYEKVMSNVEAFLALAKSCPHVRTSVSCIMQQENRGEIEEFIKLWARRVDVLNFHTRCVKGRPELCLWRPARFYCHDLFHSMIVLTDGSVVPCCRDYLYTLKMGDLHEQTLEEVWMGEKYMSMRLLQATKNFTTPKLCAECDTWMMHSEEMKIVDLADDIVLEQHPFWMRVHRK